MPSDTIPKTCVKSRSSLTTLAYVKSRLANLLLLTYMPSDTIPSYTQTYNLMSERWFTHASPTLFNAGTCRPQLSSCFLVCMKEDSIEGIYDTLKTCANISKSAGGIGLAVHCIRASGSYISGVRERVCVCIADSL